MNLAVRLYSDTANPQGLPANWPYEIRELGAGTTLPTPGTWQLMTEAQYAAHLSANAAAKATWDAANLASLSNPVNAACVGLGNDTNKPVSTAQQTAIGAKKTDSMATGKLLGRGTATTGAIEEITLGTNLSFTGTTLNAAGGAGGGITMSQGLMFSSLRG